MLSFFYCSIIPGLNLKSKALLSDLMRMKEALIFYMGTSIGTLSVRLKDNTLDKKHTNFDIGVSCTPKVGHQCAVNNAKGCVA